MTGLLARCNVFLFLIFCASANLFSQQFPDARVDQLLRSGVDNLINHHYQEAEKRFAQLKTEFPSLPLGNIYLAALKIVRAEDLGEQFDETAIAARFDEAEKQCSRLLENNGNDVWNVYFMALLKGQKAYFQALKKNYIKAFSTGISSVSHFEKCLELDPAFYESYTAIGTYKYWKSEKTSFLSWIPFVGSDKETGLKYLKLSVAKSTYNHYLAKNSLIWVYINEKLPRSAVEIAENVLRSYPESRSFKWALARAYMDIDKRKALDIYRKLLDSYLAVQNQNHYQEIVLKHKMAMIYRELGDNKNALELCNDILALNRLPGWVSERLSRRLARVNDLKSELQNL